MDQHTSGPGVRRRRFLGCAAVAGFGLTAGCLGWSEDTTAEGYERTQLQDPPRGTPGELYYAIEERIRGYDVSVERIFENDGDLIVEYVSDVERVVEEGEKALEDGDGEDATSDGDASDERAGDDSDGEPGAGDDADGEPGAGDDTPAEDGDTGDGNESAVPGVIHDEYQHHTLEEAGAIADLFNEILVKHGDGDEYGMLVGDILNPAEDQPWGWGAKSEWFELYNEGQMAEEGIMLSISQTIVYEDDVKSV